MKRSRPIILLSTLVALLMVSCSPDRYIPNDEQLYTGIKKIEVTDRKSDDNAKEAISQVEQTLAYKPNGSFLGSSKYRLPFTFGFYINEKYGNSTGFLSRWLNKTLGSEPIFISAVDAKGRATVANQRLYEYGYFNSDVRAEVIPHPKDSLQAKIAYTVTMGHPYTYDSIQYRFNIITPDSIDLFAPQDRLIQKGDPFTIRGLESERQRIAYLLRTRGYYFFRPTDIIYKADTMMHPGAVMLRVDLSDKTLPEAYKPWHLGRITYNVYDGTNRPLTDSLYYKGILFRYHQQLPIKPSILHRKIYLTTDSLYNIINENRTTRLISTLNTFAYTDVSYKRAASDSLQRLDVIITSQEDLPYYSELESTFKIKSNNQVGPGLAFTVNKKNLFRGGELLSVSAQTSYEWETNRGRVHANNWNINSYELNLNTSLTFPRVLLPLMSERNFIYPAHTRLSITGGILNRAHYYRIGQFSGSLSYKFEPQEGLRHTFTPLKMSYNHLLRTTNRFETILADNPALSLAFTNQFIPTFGYNFGYEVIRPENKHGYSIEISLSEAGNILSLFYMGAKKDARPYNFLGAPFAQFIKGTLEARYNYRFDDKTQIASRFYTGAIYSYGNTHIAPYTEQFYAGGANSIRGFNVRTLGPGSYYPAKNERLGFLDRTGDFRLESNIEFRRKVIGQLELATFIDAGNIWLLRDDPRRPGGTIKKEHFLQDIALGTGLGVRYDFSYLVLRFDLGIALHSPYLSPKKYFNTFSKNKDWYVFHIAVGYPF